MTKRQVEISPSHRLIREYYRSRQEMDAQGVEHELALRHSFQDLLGDSARLHGWTLIAELGAKAGGHTVRPDATLRDANSIPRGYWEAKDSRDDLAREIEHKIRRGYPLTNTIFEDTRRAVLYQNRDRVLEVDLSDPAELARLLHRFYSHTEPEIKEFEAAVEEFEQRVPDLAKGLAVKINEAHDRNRPFQEAFAAFFSLCQLSLNPNIRREAVDEMLVQHLLTERLFRTIFDNPEFTRRNAIAAEVERVIDALMIVSATSTAGWAFGKLAGDLFLEGIGCQQPTNRGATDLQPSGDFGFADAGAMQFPDLGGVDGRGCGPPQLLAVLTSMRQASPRSFPQNLPFKLREDRQQAGHGAPGWGGQVQRLG
jgi:hypothetical protein